MVVRGVIVRSLGRALPIRLPAVRVSPRAYTSALVYRRSYATTTRATKPTATVKKAVRTKAAAKNPAPTKKAASAKKPATKAAAKKPAAKKAPARKTPVRRAKKVLTPEEKDKATIRALRVKALKEPVSNHAMTAYNAYIAEQVISRKIKLAEASAEFKGLSPAQLEHYNHIANQKTAARRAEYKAWVNSHTPEQIRLANNARSVLRRKLAGRQKSGPANTAKIQDDRHVSIANPYAIFFKDRFESGDFKGLKVTEAAKLAGNEWKALSASEKKKFEDEFNARKTRRAAA